MDASKKLSLLRQMLFIRQFEHEWLECYKRDEFGSTPPPMSLGQEAVSVGTCAALEQGDYCLTSHRGQAPQLAMGLDPKRVMAELWCRRTGYNKGKANHRISDLSRGVIGLGGIIGAQAPIAAGIALGQKLKGTDRVALCFVGDGAANEGAVFEAANLAAVWKLPVIFLIENNQYCISLPVHKGMNIEHIADRAPAFGLPGVLVDGNDVIAMYEAVAAAVARARAGQGATWVDAETYRLHGHLAHDPQVYRSKEEVAAAWEKEPIKRYRERLTAEGLLTEAAYVAMEAEIAAEVEEAVEFARKSPLPAPAEAFEDLWA